MALTRIYLPVKSLQQPKLLTALNMWLVTLIILGLSEMGRSSPRSIRIGKSIAVFN